MYEDKRYKLTIQKDLKLPDWSRFSVQVLKRGKRTSDWIYMYSAKYHEVVKAGTYEIEYKKLYISSEGVTIRAPRGVWVIKGTMLGMSERCLKQRTQQYALPRNQDDPEGGEEFQDLGNESFTYEIIKE